MIKYFEKGLTVKELKEIIKDWPEQREDGEDCQVWLGSRDGFSNEAVEVATLNLSSDGSADLLISTEED